MSFSTTMSVSTPRSAIDDAANSAAGTLRSEKPPRFTAAQTHPAHRSFHKTIDYTTVRPDRFLDHLSTADNNGNNVDIEQESMNLVNNQLLYSMLTSSLNAQFSRLNLVLR